MAYPINALVMTPNGLALSQGADMSINGKLYPFVRHLKPVPGAPDTFDPDKCAWVGGGSGKNGRAAAYRPEDVKLHDQPF